MTKFLARSILLIVAFLFFLGAGKLLAQDTTTVKSNFQRFLIGEDNTKTDSTAYVLRFFKDNEEKILTITRSSDSSVTRIIGDEMTDFNQNEDTLIWYFNGRETSPVQTDIKLAVCQKGDNVIIVALGTSEGIIFFYTEKPAATKPK